MSHPRETYDLFGHSEAEMALLKSYRSRRMSLAWLIGGQPGIGKATLAYRMARFVLAHPDPQVDDVRSAKTLTVAPDHPVARRISSQAHPNLLVLQQKAGDNGQLRTVITVDEVRRTNAFFGSTAGEGGWRICIVDSADDLNPAGMNALLKILEEPPPQSLFLVITHAPGRLLPTIRSRCRQLILRPLAAMDIARAVAAVLEKSQEDPLLMKAATAADGSVARAIALTDGVLMNVRDQVTALLERLPSAEEGRALHTLADTLEGAEDDVFEIFLETVREWLSSRLRSGQEKRQLDQIAAVWEKFNQSARELEIFNLERKPFVFFVFSLLRQTLLVPRLRD